MLFLKRRRHEETKSSSLWEIEETLKKVEEEMKKLVDSVVESRCGTYNHGFIVKLGKEERYHELDGEKRKLVLEKTRLLNNKKN